MWARGGAFLLEISRRGENVGTGRSVHAAMIHGMLLRGLVRA
jgi:hypothetical protein